MRNFSLGTLGALLALVVLGPQTASASTALHRNEWVVDGATREALVYVAESARTNAAPLVFVFHGHGGSSKQAARSLRIHEEWPEAIVVYPQGLKTPGVLTDPEGKRSGWQHELGDQDDRDLKFFDAMFEGLRQEHDVDGTRVYCTGHSNGGAFTYLLWVARGTNFTAFAPSAAAASWKKQGLFSPKPVLHLAGEKDSLVKFEWQERTMKALRRLNQCGEGRPWEDQKGCTIYNSDLGTPVVTFIHAGGHRFPAQGPKVIVKFFKQHPRS